MIIDLRLSNDRGDYRVRGRTVESSGDQYRVAFPDEHARTAQRDIRAVIPRVHVYGEAEFGVRVVEVGRRAAESPLLGTLVKGQPIPLRLSLECIDTGGQRPVTDTAQVMDVQFPPRPAYLFDETVCWVMNKYLRAYFT